MRRRQKVGTMPARLKLEGQRFGRLTVIEFAEVRKRHAYWHCVCDCGEKLVVGASNLSSGKAKSCGCYHRDVSSQANTTHGMTRNGKRDMQSIYVRWKSMKNRCSNPANPAFNNYGGRGIKVCERWQTFESFYADMGDPPEGMTMDRIDNNGDYEPGNVRWATMSEQRKNQRPKRVIDTPAGPMLIPDAARKYGIKLKTLYWRMDNGWPILKALDIGPWASRRAMS